jgi:hypothetical protein
LNKFLTNLKSWYGVVVLILFAGGVLWLVSGRMPYLKGLIGINTNITVVDKQKSGDNKVTQVQKVTKPLVSLKLVVTKTPDTHVTTKTPTLSPSNIPTQTPKPSPTTSPSPTPYVSQSPLPVSPPTPTPTPELSPTVPSPSPTPVQLSPPSSLPKVVINEIAWMGTKASQYAEWIELYNTSSDDVDLSGWALFESGGDTKIISLGGVIYSHGYFLVERTTSSSPHAFADVAVDMSGSFGGNGLSNTGEYLVLKDGSGNVQDTVNGSSVWFSKGTASPDYRSMERIDPNKSGNESTNWATNDGIDRNGHDTNGNTINGTPRGPNSAL